MEASQSSVRKAGQLDRDTHPGTVRVSKTRETVIWAKRSRWAWFDYPGPGISISYERWKQARFTGRAGIRKDGQVPESVASRLYSRVLGVKVSTAPWDGVDELITDAYHASAASP